MFCSLALKKQNALSWMYLDIAVIKACQKLPKVSVIFLSTAG